MLALLLKDDVHTAPDTVVTAEATGGGPAGRGGAIDMTGTDDATMAFITGTDDAATLVRLAGR